MKIKVCGMKYEENIRELELLRPDYMGFLFFSGSKRFVESKLPRIEEYIDKIGVFVNQEVNEVKEAIVSNGLQGVQLHGEESPAYIERLRSLLAGSQTTIIKAFPVGDTMDWEILEPYETNCDYFLFDTKGKDRGGNGIQFDWKILSGYKLKTKYFLSGGIGPDDIGPLKDFLVSDNAEKCQAIDINSRFEVYPGMKDIDKLKVFIEDFKAI
jgi:phosphoribosylanthranilate isomerase